MYKVVSRRFLNEAQSIIEFVVEAPRVARKALPGQFIIFRLDEYGERVPVTIAGTDKEQGTVTIMVQPVGKTTKMLAMMQAGDSLADFVGPLGKPTNLEGITSACIVGGGVGNAIAISVARGLHERGVPVDMVAGFRSKSVVMLEQEMRDITTHLMITTDDGSYGESGFNVTKLRSLLEEGRKYDMVLCFGPTRMMQRVCDVTREFGVKTMASMNPIMLDGTGMCGACRLTVGGETKFACVDGPDFDGHLVDWDGIIRRNSLYVEEEKEAEKHICRITGGVREHG